MGTAEIHEAGLYLFQGDPEKHGHVAVETHADAAARDERQEPAGEEVEPVDADRPRTKQLPPSQVLVQQPGPPLAIRPLHVLRPLPCP